MNTFDNNTRYQLRFNFRDGQYLDLPAAYVDPQVVRANDITDIEANGVTYLRSSGSFASMDTYVATLSTNPDQIVLTDTTNRQAQPVVFDSPDRFLVVEQFSSAL